MKNTKVCTKCNSSDVLRILAKVGPYGTGNNIAVGYPSFSAVKVTRYLCCECGYSEEWIENKDDIEILRAKFKITSKKKSLWK